MSGPSVAVIRSLLSTHSPAFLGVIDALKEKFSARLVTLEIPASGLSLGDRSKYDSMHAWESGAKAGPKDWKPAAPEQARRKPSGRARR